MPDIEKSKAPVRVERWKSKEKPTIDAIEQMLAAETLTTYDTFELSKGWSVKGESFDRLEVRAVISGKFEYTLGAKKVVLNPGDVLFIPSHTDHSAKALAGGKLVAAFKEEFVSERGASRY